MRSEFDEPTEMERDVFGHAASYLDDLGLDLDTVVQFQAGEEVIVTTAVRTIGGEWEYYRPAVLHGTVAAWREWVEAEYAPSIYC